MPREPTRIPSLDFGVKVRISEPLICLVRKHSIFMVLRVWVLWDVIRGLMYKGSNTGLTKASSLHDREIQGFLNYGLAGMPGSRYWAHCSSRRLGPKLR